MTRVVVADDQDLVRTGLRLILGPRRHRGRGGGRDGAEAVRLARECRADVCSWTSRCRSSTAWRRPGSSPGRERTRVVVITTFDPREYVHGALRAGASGFLLKDAPDRLLGERSGPPRGDSLIAPSITRRLLSFLRGERDGPPARSTRSPTARNRSLTFARGRTNAEIAEELHISLSTVKTHIGRFMAKLGPRNRVEVAMWAYENGAWSVRVNDCAPRGLEQTGRRCRIGPPEFVVG